MAYEWIKAPLALKYVSNGIADHSAMTRICERAHSGLIPAKADLVITGEQRERDFPLGKGFWWAEGKAALEQDWQVGDFSTWIDQKVRVQAFGVSFDFMALSLLVPADQQAEALGRISTVGNDEWISASDLFQKLHDMGQASQADGVILEACQLGQIAGRALRAQGLFRDRPELNWTAREWDIPLWFWRDFAKPDFHQVWRLNKAHGEGQRHDQYLRIQLQGVYLHRSGLRIFGLANDDAPAKTNSRATAGRKPTYDWPSASLAIFGLIHRGELIPKTQADIELALIVHLTKGDDAPSESTVRPYARLIWQEHSKA